MFVICLLQHPHILNAEMEAALYTHFQYHHDIEHVNVCAIIVTH